MSISLNNDSEKTSYCLGMDIGMSFKRLPVEIDLEAAIAGLTDTFQGNEPQIKKDEFMRLMQNFQQAIRDAAEKQAAAAADENRKEEAEYLAKILKQRHGVKEVVIGYVGAVIGSHAGPDVLALFFLGEHR